MSKEKIYCADFEYPVKQALEKLTDILADSYDGSRKEEYDRAKTKFNILLAQYEQAVFYTPDK